MSETTVVQALYNFKGTNNDELWFKKGDKITVTQKEEGGWWEGTLGDKTGWFPANFVKEVKEAVSPPISPVAQQRQYRAVVLKDLIDSEKAHVTELQGLVKTFLKPLEKSSILTGDEYRQLTGNINEVLETHQQLLELLEECESKPSIEQRVGKIFLTWAPKIKQVHQAYCSMHPRAVCILDLHKDELATYMESCGAATPGLLVLTTGLSKPFRRLDKYSGMLQELERHVEINHPDRGDTQRSVAVYKDIAATCAATRRQKELELQVLTGPVRGWEGQSLAHLGDILHMGSVAVGPQHQDRYLVLFPNTLLVLSVSQRMSAFIYEGKLPLTGITVIKLDESDNCKNAFEISGPMIEKIVAICQSKEEANNWVELLRQHTKGHNKTPSPVGENVPTPPPHLDRRGYSIRSSVLNYSPSVSYKPTLPPWFYPPTSPYSTLTKSFYRLVKEKVITHRLLKKLLYPEYVYSNNIDLSQVVRRKHKTECYIRTGTYRENSDNITSSDSDSDEDTNEDSKFHRQNAILHNSSSDSVKSHISGSTESNPFGFIKYFNPLNELSAEAPCQSFIDHGEDIQQPKINETPVEESIEKQYPEKVKLGDTPQISQDSQGSSFDYVPKPFMACEDLLNIDESTEIGESFPRQYAPKTRHSLPTKFVANKFNKSSLTMVYIPQWQSNSEIAVRSKTISRTDSESSCDTTTHSSCLDVPANPLPVPDSIVAEILYNSESETENLIHSESVESDVTVMSAKTVIKPPSMFRNISTESPVVNNASLSDEIIIEPSVNLPLSNVTFRHSINSDKPKRQSAMNESKESPSTSKDVASGLSKRRSSIQENHPVAFRNRKTNSLRKCVSYHYLQLGDCQPPYNYGQFCRCCTEPCSSRRSSDSGMAGSCNLNSPDLALQNEVPVHLFPNRDHYSLSDIPNEYNCLTTDDRDVVSLSEMEARDFEARDFEAQCRCTSPFGSTPRTSCLASTSENIGILARDSTTSVTSSSSDMSPFPTPQPWESENQIYDKVMSIKGEQKSDRQKWNTQRNLASLKSKSCENFSVEEEEKQPTEIFHSGLYAHWWMKAQLPVEMIRGIIEETNSSAAGKGLLLALLVFSALCCTRVA